MLHAIVVLPSDSHDLPHRSHTKLLRPLESFPEQRAVINRNQLGSLANQARRKQHLHRLVWDLRDIQDTFDHSCCVSDAVPTAIGSRSRLQFSAESAGCMNRISGKRQQ